MTVDTKMLHRMHKLPMALGILECLPEGGPIRFAQMRTVVDCGIEVWGQQQIDEHTNDLWATIDAQAADIAEAKGQIEHLDRQNNALMDALNSAAGVIEVDRQALIDCHGLDGVIPPDDQAALDGLSEYDAVLGQICAALSQGEPE